MRFAGYWDYTRSAFAALALVMTVVAGACATITINEPRITPPATAARTIPLGQAPSAIQEREARHRTFISEGIPVEYVNRTNPLPPTQAETDAGGRLYTARCAGCHGSLGTGDGEFGRDLTLPPAVLAAMVDQPYSVDQYLFWSISEGGLRSGSQMPAFKSTLTSREIWQVVQYMRAGFPPVTPDAG